MTNQAMSQHQSPTLPPLDEVMAAELNDLLQINLDGQSGYEAAAKDLKNQDYQDLFRQYAQERQANADALSNMVRAGGHTPGKMGSLAGAFHEGWMNLRAVLSSGDLAVFAECEQADSLALAAYQEVMGRTTDEAILGPLREQFTVIRNAYERVKALRGALEQSAR